MEASVKPNPELSPSVEEWQFADDPLIIAERALMKLRAAGLTTVLDSRAKLAANIVPITADIQEVFDPKPTVPEVAVAAKKLVARATRPEEAPEQSRKAVARKRASAIPKLAKRKISKNMQIELTKPFIDPVYAQEVVPEVFAEEYEDTIEHRLLLREMVKQHKEDHAIMRKVWQSHSLRNAEMNSVAAQEKDYEPTLYTDDAFSDFLLQAGAYRLLDPSEEPKLALTMHRGILAFKQLQLAKPEEQRRDVLQALVRDGVYAYQVFFHTNLKLPIAAARATAHYYPHAEPLDVLRHGYFGVQKAIEKFDERKGFKFSTYAMNWIRESLLKGMAEEGRMIYIPGNVGIEYRRVKRITEELSKNLGREPSYQELSEATGKSLEQITILTIFGNTSMTSLNKVVGREADVELGDLLPVHTIDDSTDRLSDRLELNEMFGRADLTNQEKFIISLRYGIPFDDLIGTKFNHRHGEEYLSVYDSELGAAKVMSPQTVANRLGIRRRQVAALEKSALAKLAASSKPGDRKGPFSERSMRGL